VLQLLTRFFTHTDETDEQLQTLTDGAIGLMADVVRPLGSALTKLPVGPEHEGKTSGFAFEMYYRMGNFVPWREPAWALLHERTLLLADICDDAREHAGAPSAIAGARDRAASITDALAPSVPAALRQRLR